MLLALSACGGDALLLPSSGEPSLIKAVSGNGQTGTVGQPLDAPLEVEVTDPAGRPVPGVEVVFTAPAGAELTPNDTVVTGADGRAAVNYRLATVSGPQTIEARAKPVVPSASLTTTFSQTANPEAATELVTAGGNGQTGEVRAALGDSLAVKAVDRFSNGVPGVEVTWQSNDGTVSPTTLVTGADGRAAAQLTLGQRPGVYRSSATAELEGSPVQFEATAVALPSPQLVLVTQPSATTSAGSPFERQPVLQLQSAAGAPLRQADVGVTVQIASGGGSLGGSTTATSNAEGRVSFADLSILGQPGVRKLLFAAIDFTPITSREIDVRSGAPAPGRSSADVPANGTAGATTTISVHLQDEFGTAVAGAAGSIAVSVTGSNPSAGLTVTDRGDGSYTASYVPTVVGLDNVDVRVNGTGVPGSPFASTVVHGPVSPATTTANVVKSGVFFYQIEAFVVTRDAQGNPIGQGGDRVEVLVDGNPAPVSDNGNGTYSTTVVTLNPNPEVVIALNGVPINGSPFRP
ncbi:MAG: filamin/ABP280 repeat domain-containing protein [Gemmatimonadales bacterium]